MTDYTFQRFTARSSRLKLFDAVVTSTLLYGCETWSLRIDQQRRLSSIQRKMPRMVLNAKRRVIHTDQADSSTDTSDHDSVSSTLEPWVEFLRRTARWIDEQLQKAGLSQWIVLWKRRKWQWAGQILRDNNDKWSRRAMLWQPWVHSKIVCGRRQARPEKRWEDDFVKHIDKISPVHGKDWIGLASIRIR